MKKKRLRLVTTIAILAALFGSGGGTAWGQVGVLLSPTGSPSGTTQVNNYFGAGESSLIKTGINVNPGRNIVGPALFAPPSPNFVFTWATTYPIAFTHQLSNPSGVQDIQLGSNGVDGNGKPYGNTVIRAYTGDGYALGWISVVNKVPAPGHSNASSDPPTTYSPPFALGSHVAPTRFQKTAGEPLIEFSFNKLNYQDFDNVTKWYSGSLPIHPDLSPGSMTYLWGVYPSVSGQQAMAPCGHPVFTTVSYSDGLNGAYTIVIRQHLSGNFSTSSGPAPIPEAIYTSTISGAKLKTWSAGHFDAPSGSGVSRNYPVDDGVDLVQFSGSDMADGAAFAAQLSLVSLANNSGTLKNYQRPTTIVLEEGAHRFNSFLFNNIRWYFEKNEASITNTPSHPNAVQDLGVMGTGCNSGKPRAFAIKPYWVNATEIGQTFVDGAISLQRNARVCVENNITDATTTPGSPHDGNAVPNTETDAVLVFPDAGKRFTLRVRGSVDKINMFQTATNPTHYFTQGDFPVPVVQQPIYLYKDADDNKAHAFATPNHLGTFTNNHPSFITNHPITTAPAQEAKASIFGVFKDYIHLGSSSTNAEIHTDETPTTFDGNNPGVIELGPRGSGRGHLHAYSGGIVKNFEGCMPLDNFTMHFGGEFGTPDLKLSSDEPLYILNYGNNDDKKICSANIIFHNDPVDTVALAINGDAAHYGSVPNGKGTMRIQALGDVEFKRDEDWKPAQQNNVLVLSDARNVITQKVKYEGGYQDGIAQGLLTFWAEDKNDAIADCNNSGIADRNSVRGNVYMNDLVEIKRTAVGGTTETNVIAANNIRTSAFKFHSENTDKDTTNIYSRKGDIYMGYSVKTAVVPGPDNGKNFDDNLFEYKVDDPGNTGVLNIKAGWDDAKPTMTATPGMEGGNVYFTGIKTDLIATGEYPTFITIPYSSEYICDAHVNGESLHNRKNTYQAYEHSGIIGGVGACGYEGDWAHYGSKLIGSAAASDLNRFTKKSLEYKGNKGHLTVDAGKRGNIIMNTGGLLDFQNDNGNAIFRTREGDIDMRDPFDAKEMTGSLLFLAQIADITKLSNIGVCGCEEERNNVYLQDFKYIASTANNSGSVFVGADNNIKLNYGGLANIGTRQDPFLSKAYKEDPQTHRPLKVGRGYAGGTGGCGNSFHCDLDGSENKARDLELNFSGSVTSGGFAAVASDMIDVYKNLIYHGGTGSGLSTVPETGTLHGEDVAGYGLFMKTQGNKHNWTDNILLQAPKCPTTCSPTGCGEGGRPATGFLHNTVRMTFHSDARFYAENQHVHLESPVIETFGVLELNAEDNAGAKAMITIKTDSLICHDSLIRKGTGKVQLTTWSGLPKDQPIIKLGYSRKAAPFAEYSVDEDLSGAPKLCRECVSHYKGKVYPPGETPLDTMFVKFGPDTEWERQNVMVVDHTVISFLTDSFDHVKGGDVLNARYFVDTTKIRNQVEFWTDAKHERDGHLELISEEQMGSKDYAGLYTRHLHLEPIGACGRPTSELWLPGLALDVITTSTFGGFGIQYTDVHVENGANLNPGFTSLRLRGQCYEQACGTLTMKDLRLDGGSELHFSVGTTKGLNGEYSDAIDVDRLTTYGPVNVNIEIRPCEKIQKRCYPIMYYKSVTPNSLNNLKLNPRKVMIDGEEYPLSLNVSTDGIVYVCVGDAVTPGLTHTVTMPETAGVKTTPSKGIYPLPTRTSFRFSATYSGAKPLVVRTNRKVNGQQEVLNGVKNANGEYEYIVPSVQQEVTLTFGPDVVANELLTAGTAVWSHGEKIYIRVERADIASIYSVAGQLVKRVDLPEGDTSIPMSRGAYVITLKDGSVHKVIVK